jgi:hypothetical protein
LESALPILFGAMMLSQKDTQHSLAHALAWRMAPDE